MLLGGAVPAALAAEPAELELTKLELQEEIEINTWMDLAEYSATVLYNNGLFNGIGDYPDGTPNFALDHATNRHQAITMLVRLLGKEDEALSGNWDIPFTDVDEWARPYVGYAYANGLTNGTSPTTFSGKRNVKATEYLTLVLRALGYSSQTDFRWDAAWELADAIELTFGQYNEDYNTTLITVDENGNYDLSFKRGDVAIVSLSALVTECKGTDVLLKDRLFGYDPAPVTDVTEEQAYQAMIAMKSQYPEGMRWTNADGYDWNGYSYENGVYYATGYGCAGFAFILSDAAFGTLPACYAPVDFDTIRVGDILRLNNNTHSVIILEKHANYVVIAEGNYNSSIHWGRTLTRDEVNRGDYVLTRYPE